MDVVSQKLEEVLHRLAFEEIKGDSPHSDSDPLLARLKVLGTEVWVDTGELEKAQEIRQVLFGEQEDSDSDEEELVNMDDEDEFSENDCSCPVCRVMNNIYTRWQGWTPTTLFEKTIKKHIDKM